NRCRCERCWIKRGKQAFGRSAELLLDDLLDEGVSDGRVLAQQLEQLRAVLAWDQVEAQGKCLANLDPCSSELLQEMTEPDGRRLPPACADPHGGENEERRKGHADLQHPPGQGQCGGAPRQCRPSGWLTGSGPALTAPLKLILAAMPAASR